MNEPTDAAILERAQSLANEALHMVGLQRRRLRSEEPEDQAFVFRQWADMQFLVVSLRRLRLAGQLAARSDSGRAPVKAALREFDNALPDLRKMRNVGEHIDEYAVEAGRDREVDRRQLQVGSFDGTTFIWVGGKIDVDQAFKAARHLYEEIRTACAAGPAPMP
jgi:hypothetical protein